MHREAKATTPKRVLGSRGDDVGSKPLIFAKLKRSVKDPDEKDQLTSVFRFFPIKVSSIAAISFDAIVDAKYVAGQRFSKVVFCQTIAFIISENFSHTH